MEKKEKQEVAIAVPESALNALRGLLVEIEAPPVPFTGDFIQMRVAADKQRKETLWQIKRLMSEHFGGAW